MSVSIKRPRDELGKNEQPPAKKAKLTKLLDIWHEEYQKSMCSSDLVKKLKINKDVLCVILQYLPSLFKTEETEIPLKFHSHRQHFSINMPWNVLNSTCSYYASDLNCNFKDGEYDWIIFKFKDCNDIYHPTRIEITNLVCGWKEWDVKEFQLFFGDPQSDNWYPLSDFNMFNENFKELESHDLNINQEKRFKYFKLTLMTNHAHDPIPYFYRFCIQQLNIYGKQF